MVIEKYYDFYKLSNINIEEYFLNLIDKHFKKNSPLRKIFHRNSLKISHSYTRNMSKIMYNHNNKSLVNINLNNNEPINALVIVELKRNAPWKETVS